MRPTVLSTLDLMRFAKQIEMGQIGIEGQETLKYSEVIINGMGGIGIIVLHCLLTAGVERITIIDNRIVNNEMLPSQSLFNEGDINNLRILAAHRKGIIGKNVTVLNTVMTSKNIDRLIGSAKIVVEAIQSKGLANDLLDLANEKGFYLVGGFGVNWKGVYGIYCGDNKEKFKTLMNDYFNRLHPYDYEHPYFGFMSNIIGGAITAKILDVLLKPGKSQSELYEIDLFNFKIASSLGFGLL